ncbi:MAG: hypothetical protein ACPL1D_00915 [Microgenomates group bacterium]
MENLNSNNNLIRSFDEEKITIGGLLVLIFLVIFLGGIVGLAINKISLLSLNKKNNILSVGKSKKKVGIEDKKKFKDRAEGILREGGIDGEGNYHLERPGGPSQNVYLTSSVIDLSQFVGKKIRVWGETFAGEKAGWLMDVGLVEVLN